jgi:hypothetical protein
MSIQTPQFRAIVSRLLADLEPEDCEEPAEYEMAVELHALPIGVDLWSRMFLSPDGEVIWAGWDPLEIKRSRLEEDVNAAVRMAAERYPAMIDFVQPPSGPGA